jgi:quercetin dioxygenase-like cupin family protein
VDKTGDEKMKLAVDTNKVPFQKVDRAQKYPGVGKIPDQVGNIEGIYYKYFGENPKDGPWVYMVKFPAGHHIDKHSHAADRVEYVLDGEILFEGETLGAGAFTFITARTQYEYDILKETTILLIFNGPPGIIM